MLEVESLNKSIEELCPEIIGTSKYPSIVEQRSELSDLIEHRIQMLTEFSKENSVTKQA